MQKFELCMLVISAALLSGCGKKEEAGAPAAASAPAVASLPSSSQPDFGGITKVSREVEAVGSTPELAVLAGLQMAVAQVNGLRVASQMQSVRAGLDMSVNGQSAGSVRAEAFAQKLIAASQGAVTGFEVLSQEEVDKVDEEAVSRVRASDGGYSYSASASSDSSVNVRSDGNASAHNGTSSAQVSGSFDGSAKSSESAKVDVKRGASSYESDATFRKMRSYWKVRVKVDVAQYRAPDELGRPKIVVALPRTLTQNYPVGDDSVAAGEVAQAVRGRLSDMLAQTKRFIVLDREFGAEMQAEIDHINSGNVRVQDGARLAQQLATDLLLIPTIERFEYPRRVQKLRMSDRELVSYSGSGRITLRLLNAATGEVVMSESFEHKLADADPSTMPRAVDGKNMATEMMNSLSSQMGSAIVAEIFPVSVVSLNGDQAVLSQGGESLQVGQRWQAVALGDELKDPQTGRSLGRNEVPIGIVRIDRVSGKTSYGTFEGGAPQQSPAFKPGSIELRQRMEAKKAEKAQDTTPAVAAKPAARVVRHEPVAEPASAKERPARKEEDKNW
jgi:curli biogenesis system outer membrane secretion channel CsgG/PBP1b-binding outer membrane lipoprotein LpoB